MESPVGELHVGTLDVAPVGTCDGCSFDAPYARTMARRYYILGFFGLPWFWIVSAWLFSPNLEKGGDAVVQKYVKRSLIWLGVYSTIFATWFVVYVGFGERVLGSSLYNELDIMNVDMSGSGLSG